MRKIPEKLRAWVKAPSFPTKLATLIVIAALIVVNVTVYALDTAFGLYIYTPDTEDLTVSGRTDSMFSDAIKLGKEVSVIFCMPEDERSVHSTGSYVYKTAKQLAARYPDLIKLDFWNIITKRDAHGNRVEVYKQDMRGNEIDVRQNSVIFRCGDNYRVVTDSYSKAGFAPFFTLDSSSSITSYNGEEVLSSMIAWVLTSEHKTAYFTTYHGETTDISLTNLLACAGYYVDTVDLRTGNVPEDAAALFIMNPTADFERAAEGSGVVSEMERIRLFAAAGGDIYVSLDPYAKRLPALEGFLSERGIALATTERDGVTYRNIIKDPDNAITTDGFTVRADIADGETASRIFSRYSETGSGDVIVSSTAALTLTGGAVPVLVTTRSAETVAGGVTVSREGNYTVAAMSATETEGGTSNLFVTPSIYLTASDALISSGYSNKDFTYSLLAEFSGNDNMPYGIKSVLYNKSTLQNLTMSTARAYTAAILAVPALLALIGVVVTVRRKNR